MHDENDAWSYQQRHVSMQVPSEQLLRAGDVLRTVVLTRAPHMIRDRTFHQRTYRRCLVGTEMVDWLEQHAIVTSRQQAVGMWQALLEEGVIVHGKTDSTHQLHQH